MPNAYGFHMKNRLVEHSFIFCRKRLLRGAVFLPLKFAYNFLSFLSKYGNHMVFSIPKINTLGEFD